MIVLAVTGALFVAIAATLSGRQGAAEFTRSIQAVQSGIQQIINQVPAGFFPDRGLSCSNSGGVPSFNIGGNQGANAPCVFLGKVIQFGVQGSGGSQPEVYRTYTVAGLRCVPATGANCPALGASSPFSAAVPAVAGVSGNYIDYSDAQNLQYGMETAWIHSDNCPTGCSIGAVALLMEPGSPDGTSATGLDAGAQQVDLIPVYTTRLDKSPTDIVSELEDDTSGSGGLRDPNLGNDINPAGGVQICFTSGTTKQSGLITIGSSGRQLLVQLSIKGNQTCS